MSFFPPLRRLLLAGPLSVTFVALSLLNVTAAARAADPVSVAPPVAITSTADGLGYWITAADGGVFSFGSAKFYGSEGSTPLQKPVVGMARTPKGDGYWLVAADGGLFNHGEAGFYGSLPGIHVVPDQPIVGIAATPTGRGYWMVGADGGVFSFGDAGYHNSLPGLGITPNKPIVGIAATATGDGYWLVGADGGVYAFGDARFRGSMGGQPLNRPVVGMARSTAGDGYWLAAGDGGIFTFGDARFLGSMAASQLNAPVVGVAPNPRGGYWMLGGDGGVFSFGSQSGYHGRVRYTPPASDPTNTGSPLGSYGLAAGAMRPAVPTLRPSIDGYLRRMAGLAGGFVVTTGSNHAKYTVNGNLSDHWTGDAADLGMTANGSVNDGRRGDDLMTACLQLAGMAADTARTKATRGGLFTFTLPDPIDATGRARVRVQCIWKTNEGGNHHNHVHVGARRIS
ncbi:MAG TPA: hypothetical protein VF533_13990 [Solirubrobacteraceae bacterium]|jgi:hypothetical protein